MKIDAKTTESEFKPKYVSITIETRDEFRTMREMCRLNDTIPHEVSEFDGGKNTKEITTIFLDLLANALDNSQK